MAGKGVDVPARFEAEAETGGKGDLGARDRADVASEGLSRRRLAIGDEVLPGGIEAAAEAKPQRGGSKVEHAQRRDLPTGQGGLGAQVVIGRDGATVPSPGEDTEPGQVGAQSQGAEPGDAERLVERPVDTAAGHHPDRRVERLCLAAPGRLAVGQRTKAGPGEERVLAAADDHAALVDPVGQAAPHPVLALRQGEAPTRRHLHLGHQACLREVEEHVDARVLEQQSTGAPGPRERGEHEVGLPLEVEGEGWVLHHGRAAGGGHRPALRVAPGLLQGHAGVAGAVGRARQAREEMVREDAALETLGFLGILARAGRGDHREAFHQPLAARRDGEGRGGCGALCAQDVARLAGVDDEEAKVGGERRHRLAQLPGGQLGAQKVKCLAVGVAAVVDDHHRALAGPRLATQPITELVEDLAHVVAVATLNQREVRRRDATQGDEQLTHATGIALGVAEVEIGGEPAVGADHDRVATLPRLGGEGQQESDQRPSLRSRSSAWAQPGMRRPDAATMSGHARGPSQRRQMSRSSPGVSSRATAASS